MKQYLAIIEKTKTGYGAYLPDVPGVVAAGPTVDLATKLIQEGLQIWMEETRTSGLPIPEPNAQMFLVECA